MILCLQHDPLKSVDRILIGSMNTAVNRFIAICPCEIEDIQMSSVNKKFVSNSQAFNQAHGFEMVNMEKYTKK